MAHVTTPDGRDLGDITDLGLLAYYRGEGCTIDEVVQPDPAVALDELTRASASAASATAELADTVRQLGTATDPATDTRTEPDTTSNESGTPSV